MIPASSMKTGAVVTLEGQRFKVIESLLHAGGGKSGSMVHAKLRNLSTGTFLERRFDPGDKIEDLAVERVKMQYLYSAGESFNFMNPETFDQVAILGNVVGPASRFLKENDLIEIEFYEGSPLSIHYPSIVELAVRSTGAGLRGKTDSTFKEATLDNGMQVLVPQFIKEGDHVHVDVESGKYLDRVMEKEKKQEKSKP